MTKSKSSGSSIVVSPIFVIHLVNDAQFLNATCVAGAAVTVIFNIASYENVNIVIDNFISYIVIRF